MNKKVLTTAQVRAMFKNYTMSLAVAGVAIASSSCKDKPTGKTGSENISNEGDKKFVTSVDLDTKLAAKASAFTPSFDNAQSLLDVAGTKLDLSSLKSGSVTAGSLKDLLNATGWTKDATTNEVTFTTNPTGQNFAQVVAGPTSGLTEKEVLAMFASGDIVWKYTPAVAASGNTAATPAKLEKVAATEPGATTFAEALKAAWSLSNANAVDKNDAKIVVKGVAKTATVVAAYADTFTTNPTGAVPDNGEKEVSVSEELKAAKAEVKGLRTELDAEKNKNAKLEVMHQVDLLPAVATFNRIHEAKRVLHHYFKANPGELSLFKGVYSAANVISNIAALDIVNAASGNSFKAGDIFLLHEATGSTVYVVKTKVDIPNNAASGLASATNPVDIITANATGLITKTNSGFGAA